MQLPRDIVRSDITPDTYSRVHVDNPNAAHYLAQGLLHYIEGRGFAASHRPLVVVCVGTDRSTGDALGPLVGTHLEELNLANMHVYGTLEDPVHATNLEARSRAIYQKHKGSLILAVDACLGKNESVGFLSLKGGPLLPGTGVNKDLPAIGELHLIGVVNVGGFMEYFVLQNTRLSLVLRMSRVIARALALTAEALPNLSPTRGRTNLFA